MIQPPKFQFKSKGPTSKKNRMIRLCIDGTTCVLIVGVFFLARYLHSRLPPSAHPLVKHSAPAVPKTVATASNAAPMTAQVTSDTAPASTPAQSSPATSDVAAAPAATSGGSFTPVEIPGASNNAESNLAGWITSSKSDKKPVYTTPADQVSGKTDGNPATSGFASSAPTETAKPAPVSLGDSLMSVISPSARGSTIQPEMVPAKNWSQTTVPSARRTMKAKPVVAKESATLTDDQRLLQTAQSSFDYVLELALKNPDIYGFKPNEQISEAKLGEPIRVYTVTVADRKNYEVGQPLQPILQATNEWIFPVMLSSRVRFMVPVKRIGNDYVAETTSRSLAMVYEKIQTRWPASEGFHPQIVVNANIATYYFTIPELADPNLTDTSEMFQFNPTLSPASVILGSWR